MDIQQIWRVIKFYWHATIYELKYFFKLPPKD